MQTSNFSFSNSFTNYVTVLCYFYISCFIILYMLKCSILLEIGLVLTQPINHGPWIVHMGYLISKFKFKLTDIGMSYQYQ